MLLVTDELIRTVSNDDNWTIFYKRFKSVHTWRGQADKNILQYVICRNIHGYNGAGRSILLNLPGNIYSLIAN